MSEDDFVGWYSPRPTEKDRIVVQEWLTRTRLIRELRGEAIAWGDDVEQAERMTCAADAIESLMAERLALQGVIAAAQRWSDYPHTKKMAELDAILARAFGVGNE